MNSIIDRSTVRTKQCCKMQGIKCTLQEKMSTLEDNQTGTTTLQQYNAELIDIKTLVKRKPSYT